jgi:hypothetical protein
MAPPGPELLPLSLVHPTNIVPPPPCRWWHQHDTRGEDHPAPAPAYRGAAAAANNNAAGAGGWGDASAALQPPQGQGWGDSSASGGYGGGGYGGSGGGRHAAAQQQPQGFRGYGGGGAPQKAPAAVAPAADTYDASAAVQVCLAAARSAPLGLLAHSAAGCPALTVTRLPVHNAGACAWLQQGCGRAVQDATAQGARSGPSKHALS